MFCGAACCVSSPLRSTSRWATFAFGRIVTAISDVFVSTSGAWLRPHCLVDGGDAHREVDLTRSLVERERSAGGREPGQIAERPSLFPMVPRAA